MSISIALIDAFTSAPFTGNPAAVCILDREMPEAWMQSTAAEMNQSETAFLFRIGVGFKLRWFTPEVEVDLCGHATLASAKYLYAEGLIDPSQPIYFETKSGTLSATISEEGKSIALDFPAIESHPIEYSPSLSVALGADPLSVHRGRFDYLVELDSDEIVRSLTPDFQALKQIEARGIVVTAKAAENSNYDFISRGFFPQSGIDEDPVTGSAHCMLAPFWGERVGKTQMTGFQASKRGGFVKVELQTLHVRADRVILTGNAIIVMKGKLQF